MTFERFNGEHSYGVMTTLISGEQIGLEENHTQLTRSNPDIVERFLDRMESDLSQQLSAFLLKVEIK